MSQNGGHGAYSDARRRRSLALWFGNLPSLLLLEASERVSQSTFSTTFPSGIIIRRSVLATRTTTAAEAVTLFNSGKLVMSSPSSSFFAPILREQHR